MELNKVPSIITGKDLDYLSDMFNWNYGAYKSAYNSLENINDEEIKCIAESIIKEHDKKQKDTQHYGKNGEDQIPPEEAVTGRCRSAGSFAGRFRFLCHGQSRVSNLYPTPQTVLSSHLSETPSSFSRIRLTCTSTVRESPKYLNPQISSNS